MPRFAANLSLLFNEYPFLDRFGAAAAAGFEGVEYLFPYAWRREDLAEKLQQHRLTQVLFNLPAGDWEAGERGIACLPDRIEEFREGVFQALDYARALDCRRLNCLAGLWHDVDQARPAWDTLVENLRFAADLLAPEGITLTVEAINSRVDMPGFLLDTSARAMTAINACGRDNVLLQYDLYHMQIMEGDLCRSLSRLCPHIGHIQFADNPGRHEPGSGEIHFPVVFAHLDRLDYQGWVSAEYHPLAGTEAGLGWLHDFKETQCE
ncbi:hydroxypyruvate isomerase [Alcanivorax hongdengensis A-11-3]|uniref:Hydroxypyruvate isomerase n=1 Tax=Alcanivorax hongdengensis A-11-3 TaxID=1177179 RepID=L0W844_9GAMM|nr:hydroxypyruvate isomerase [Alcanivorax hongdengensis]EKF73081.1 hydroxypyruvate isomerase [Alcanivorax hongdengensis A-11-3]